MTPERRAIETQVLYMNMVDYWYEVDLKGGAGVSEMYVEDGIFHGGPRQGAGGSRGDRAVLHVAQGSRRAHLTSRHHQFPRGLQRTRRTRPPTA